jgi:hypothetical protein
MGTGAYNVPVVTDVFLRPMRKNAKCFYGHKKMWLHKTVQKALARTRFCVARAAEAVTNLLRLQKNIASKKMTSKYA